MKIVIDARMYNESGVGRYIRNLLVNLQKLDKKNEYFILHLEKDFINLKYQNNFKKVLANFHWYGVSEQVKLPRLLDKLKPDLVHFPHFNVPIFYRGKFIVTIHDLIHQHYSMQRATTHGPFIYKFKKWGYKKIFYHAIKKSQKILVPSNFVREQLTGESNVNNDKIIETSEAVDDKIFSIGKIMKKDKMDRIVKKFNIKPPFIFYIGNAHPHKNVEGLIRAFLEIRKNYQYLQLVLSGNDHYFWQKIKKENKHKDIVYTGFISDEELVALYKSAQVFVLPSFEEGFGIPLLEAMACSASIVSSNAGALPEVGGEAVLYFDPKNQDDMSDKIMQVLNNEKLRKELVEKGRKRVKEFSWERLAKQTLEVYQ